ncbi:lytic transglycosylase domain-containing protein [Bartonella doshiae]|uniref:lytic transglycosylase domain-containing protein n=1 Tax=Bartonella doshiae TaxID=33044 RepID=UPI00094405AC|nr:lytic transglycosylase domain-containing protein [Bartonella doshiae]
MTIPDFMMLAAACAPAIHPTTLSAIIMQESQGHVYAIGINGNHKLSHQPSTLSEAITIAEKLKHDGHNFDIGLGQINVKNLEWLDMSLFDLFDPCKNLKALQIILTHCYERTRMKYSSEQTALQAALSCYSMRDFKNNFTKFYMQKITSYAAVQIPALVSVGNESQKFVKLHTGEPERTVKTESFSDSPEELADAFAHKSSGVLDAFTTKGTFPLKKQ